MSAERRTVHLPIAQPTGLAGTVGVLTAVFDVPVPDLAPRASGDQLLDVSRAWYAAQADAFLRLMESHAPGGFVEALLGRLLARRASIYVIPDAVLAGGSWVPVEVALPPVTERPVHVQLEDGSA